MIDLGLAEQMSMGGGSPGMGMGAGSMERVQAQMQSHMQQTMEFQSYASELQGKQSTFNTVIHAKQQLMKDLYDIAKESVQKGGSQ